VFSVTGKGLTRLNNLTDTTSNPNSLDSDSFPILVVEDDPVTRGILEKSLTKSGMKVVAAENGRKALDLLEKTFFPIVITDWMMPELDGLELCQRIRKMEWPSYVFIILLTARGAVDDIITGLDAGADDYLTKPFNKAELKARLRAGTRILGLYDKINKLSITDPLTQCFNRGYLMKNLTREIKRSIRYKNNLFIVMSDIDHFKNINDSYGHQAGDLVLKEFASLIMNSFRDEVDWLARYGGEEFILVLPETGRDGAWQAAERLRKKVSDMVIPVKEEKIQITASFGISGFEGHNSVVNISANTLIEQADKCLYQAKREGRNRVVLTELDKTFCQSA
jgi:diguanylate cyclase (GGDEF)-like protein